MSGETTFILLFMIATAARALVIFGVSALLRTFRERIPWSWSVILTWGGLRGALPMVLVLSLPSSFPHRDLLVTMTFGVVILSILVHGLAVSRFLKWLGIVTGGEARETYEFLKGKLRAAHAALSDIERLERGSLKDEGVLSDLQEEYEAMIRRDEEELGSLRIDRKQLRMEEMQRARRQLLLAERKHLLETFHQGMLSQRAYEKLLEDLDARLLKLETEGGEEEV